MRHENHSVPPTYFLGVKGEKDKKKSYAATSMHIVSVEYEI